jgi:hypothetical protein
MKVATFLWALFPVLGALAAPTVIVSTNGLSRRSLDHSIGILDLHSTIEKEKTQYPSCEIESRAPKNAATLTMTRLGTSFTWAASMPAGFYTVSQAIEYAQTGYEQMKTKNPSGFETKNGKFEHTTLVACVFIPGKGFFLGTAPGTKGFHYEPAQAPAWWGKVSGRKILIPGRARWHAEDVAMYMFEKSLTTKLAVTATYPQNSFMVVWGHFGPLGNQLGDTVPAQKSVCGQSGTATIDPSCADVLLALGIGFQGSSTFRGSGALAVGDQGWSEWAWTQEHNCFERHRQKSNGEWQWEYSSGESQAEGSSASSVGDQGWSEWAWAQEYNCYERHRQKSNGEMEWQYLSPEERR